ncbi:MAG TPA: SCO family protein [Candidatus Sulfotelmatobacter sp.]
MKLRKSLMVVVLLTALRGWPAETHALSGLVVNVDAAHKSLTVSCNSVPGYMDAMTMPFDVREAKTLEGIKPGATIDFTVVVQGDSSYAENIRVHPYENLEQEPLEARRLAIVSKLANPAAAAKVLNLQQRVPDFTLTDQARNKIVFSQFNGKVVALSFAYVRCPNPSYCFRLTNHLGELQKRFTRVLGKDLVLLTIIIDPEHDQNDAIKQYAAIWHADPQAWHFLTGPLPEVQRVSRMFGMEFWNDEGFLTHSFHTAIIDRQGKLFANLEGNQFTSQQLGDLVQTVITRR